MSNVDDSRAVGEPGQTVDRNEFCVDAHAHPGFLRVELGLDGTTTQLEFPVVEPGAITFAWRGEADAVWLRHFMALDSESFALGRAPGSDWWLLRLQVPDGARFEYKFDIVRDGHGQWVTDPLNPNLATDPHGANSVCETWGYSPPDWAEPEAAAGAGSIERLRINSDAFGGLREVGVYLPAGYEARQIHPLVIVHDGHDYVDHAGLGTVLDNLIERGDLPPLIAVLTQSPDRMNEYVDDPRHAAFITAEMLPALESAYHLSARARDRVLMGASLGAVASLSVAARAPRLFGGVVLKSGSFIFDRTLLTSRAELFRRVSEFVDGLGGGESLLHRAFISCGRYEGLVSQNRRLASFLRRAGVATRYVESRDAHHWGNWRDQIRAGLMWCLSPPRSGSPEPDKCRIEGET